MNLSSPVAKKSCCYMLVPQQILLSHTIHLLGNINVLSKDNKIIFDRLDITHLYICQCGCFIINNHFILQRYVRQTHGEDERFAPSGLKNQDPGLAPKVFVPSMKTRRHLNVTQRQ